ncbi:hypothetical protein BDD12DRAFT_982353, partial [Trichophaea hybrida]
MSHSRDHLVPFPDPKIGSRAIFPGAILSLPAGDLNLITPWGRVNHPVLVLYTEPSKTLVCSIILTFRGSFQYKSTCERLQYLPLAPTDPHPDTGEILEIMTTGTPSVQDVTSPRLYEPSRRLNSYTNLESWDQSRYIKLHDSFIVLPAQLEQLHKGTARLTEKAMDTVRWKILNPGEKTLAMIYEKNQRQRLEMLKKSIEARAGKFGWVYEMKYRFGMRNPKDGVYRNDPSAIAWRWVLEPMMDWYNKQRTP